MANQLNRAIIFAVIVAAAFVAPAFAGGSTASPAAESRSIAARLRANDGLQLAQANTTAPGAPAAAPRAVTLRLGAVPTLDLGAIEVGLAKGFFREQGIAIEYTLADGGPPVVNGVIGGTFDIGYVSYTPPLLALAAGQKLRLVSGLADIGPDRTNSTTLVRRDRGITSFMDLAGKTVATNAPRSLMSLTLPASITAAGADGKRVKIVPLPFGEIARAVAEGKIDAGITIEPFVAIAKLKYPELVEIGDPNAILGKGAPSTLIFTSEATMNSKAREIKRFQDAMVKSIAYANANTEEVRTAGAKLVRIPPESARLMPINPFNAKVTVDSLRPLVDMMVTYGWLDKPVDVNAFVGR